MRFRTLIWSGILFVSLFGSSMSEGTVSRVEETVNIEMDNTEGEVVTANKIVKAANFTNTILVTNNNSDEVKHGIEKKRSAVFPVYKIYESKKENETQVSTASQTKPQVEVKNNFPYNFVKNTKLYSSKYLGTPKREKDDHENSEEEAESEDNEVEEVEEDDDEESDEQEAINRIAKATERLVADKKDREEVEEKKEWIKPNEKKKDNVNYVITSAGVTINGQLKSRKDAEKKQPLYHQNESKKVEVRPFREKEKNQEAQTLRQRDTTSGEFRKPSYLKKATPPSILYRRDGEEDREKPKPKDSKEGQTRHYWNNGREVKWRNTDREEIEDDSEPPTETRVRVNSEERPRKLPKNNDRSEVQTSRQKGKALGEYRKPSYVNRAPPASSYNRLREEENPETLRAKDSREGQTRHYWNSVAEVKAQNPSDLEEIEDDPEPPVETRARFNSEERPRKHPKNNDRSELQTSRQEEKAPSEFRKPAYVNNALPTSPYNRDREEEETPRPKDNREGQTRHYWNNAVEVKAQNPSDSEDIEDDPEPPVETRARFNSEERPPTEARSKVNFEERPLKQKENPTSGFKPYLSGNRFNKQSSYHRDREEEESEPPRQKEKSNANLISPTHTKPRKDLENESTHHEEDKDEEETEVERPREREHVEYLGPVRASEIEFTTSHPYEDPQPISYASVVYDPDGNSRTEFSGSYYDKQPVISERQDEVKEGSENSVEDTRSVPYTTPTPTHLYSIQTPLNEIKFVDPFAPTSKYDEFEQFFTQPIKPRKPYAPSLHSQAESSSFAPHKHREEKTDVEERQDDVREAGPYVPGAPVRYTLAPSSGKRSEEEFAEERSRRPPHFREETNQVESYPKHRTKPAFPEEKRPRVEYHGHRPEVTTALPYKQKLYHRQHEHRPAPVDETDYKPKRYPTKQPKKYYNEREGEGVRNYVPYNKTGLTYGPKEKSTDRENKYKSESKNIYNRQPQKFRTDDEEVEETITRKPDVQVEAQNEPEIPRFQFPIFRPENAPQQTYQNLEETDDLYNQVLANIESVFGLKTQHLIPTNNEQQQFIPNPIIPVDYQSHLLPHFEHNSYENLRKDEENDSEEENEEIQNEDVEDVEDKEDVRDEDENEDLVDYEEDEDADSDTQHVQVKPNSGSRSEVDDLRPYGDHGKPGYKSREKETFREATTASYRNEVESEPSKHRSNAKHVHSDTIARVIVKDSPVPHDIVRVIVPTVVTKDSIAIPAHQKWVRV